MHLLAAISPHGFGHLAQSAAVLNALRRRLPGLRLTVRSALPGEVLARRIEGEFALEPVADDFGMVQRDALTVDVEASAARYAAFHRDWQARVNGVAESLAAAAPDLIFADIPYLTLAAAERAGIPSLAMCCLNWADIYRHYCGGRPEAPGILDRMEAAYNSAWRFLRTEPSMPMPFLANARDIGPVMTAGRNRRDEIDRQFGTQEEKLVLVAMGGIPLRLPVEAWPRIAGVRWLVQRDWNATHPDALALEDLAMPFSDVLASSDLLLTKPGYGSFTEAAAGGVPVLYLPRPDWPESPYLEGWLARNTRAEALVSGGEEGPSLREAVERLLAGGRYRPVTASGVPAAVTAIEERLLARSN